MAKRQSTKVAFLFGLSLCSVLTLLAQNEIQLPPSSLKIDQVYINLPLIDVYFWTTDSVGGMVNNLDVAKMKITVGTKFVSNVSELKINRFKDLNEGTAFTLLIDKSLSVHGPGLENSKVAASRLVQQMMDKDKAMVIVFGNKIDVLVPFTNNKPLLEEKIREVVAEASNTLLYEAINTAFRQNITYDPDVPRRKAIVVLSDGRDEGSGLTIDDLKDNALFPVYAIGYEAGRKEYIESLMRISTFSGGRYIHLLNLRDAETAYQKILEFIGSQWRLQLKACGLQPETTPQGIELTYTDTLLLSDKKTARLFSSLSRKEHKSLCRTRLPIPLWIFIAGGGSLFLFLLLGLFLVLRSKKKASLARESEAGDWGEAGGKGGDAPIIIEEPMAKTFRAGETDLSPEHTSGISATEKDPDVTANLSFSFMEGPEKGKRKVVPVRSNQLKIGRGGLSDFIIEDAEISSEHAILTQEKKYFCIQDNNSKNGVYVNGIKVTAVKRIEKGDVLLIGGTKLRFDGEVKDDEA